MSRILKRPMFRRGGKVNEGIMSGIVDRTKHAKDPFVTGIGQTVNKLTPEFERLLSQYTPKTRLPIGQLGLNLALFLLMFKYWTMVKRLAIIPARGGSKRIRNKNIKLFCGRPVITHTVDNLLKSKLFSKIHISTESKKLWMFVKKKSNLNF